ncbi:uncharacterized protein G2W53_023681 [Senna tora]|uniref:Uncharacterized protein n=1 Tax=Senna tora TaxID=362788 RepID=A0A834WG93_9FABA|nr:uncharacterized protein G2W53_023681 [Senna tora]
MQISISTSAVEIISSSLELATTSPERRLKSTSSKTGNSTSSSRDHIEKDDRGKKYDHKGCELGESNYEQPKKEVTEGEILETPLRKSNRTGSGNSS